MLVAPTESSVGMSLTVYMSSNALFVMMALFIWLRPGEYRNYITLYMAGKVIAIVSFYVWEIFSFREFIREFLRAGTLAKNLFVLGGGALLSLADIFSVCGAWAINKKILRAKAHERGGE